MITTAQRIWISIIILNAARRSVRVLAVPTDYSNDILLQSQTRTLQNNESKANHIEKIKFNDSNYQMKENDFKTTEDDIENFKTVADDYEDLKLDTVFNNNDSNVNVSKDDFVPIHKVNHFRINLESNNCDSDVIGESELITDKKHFDGNASVVYVAGTGKDIFDFKEEIQRHGEGNELLVYFYIFRNMKYYYLGHLTTDSTILRECLSRNPTIFCVDMFNNGWWHNNINHTINKNYVNQVRDKLGNFYQKQRDFQNKNTHMSLKSNNNALITSTKMEINNANETPNKQSSMLRLGLKQNKQNITENMKTHKDVAAPTSTNGIECPFPSKFRIEQDIGSNITNYEIPVDQPSSVVLNTNFDVSNDNALQKHSNFSLDDNSLKKNETLGDTIELDKIEYVPSNWSDSHTLDLPFKKVMEGNTMVVGACPNGNISALENGNLNVNTGINGNTKIGSYVMNLPSNKDHKDIDNNKLFYSKQSPKTIYFNRLISQPNYIGAFPYHAHKLSNNEGYHTHKEELQVKNPDGVIKNSNYQSILRNPIPTDANNNVRNINNKYFKQINLKPAIIPPGITGLYPSEYIMGKLQKPKNEVPLNQNSLYNILSSTKQRTHPKMEQYDNLFSRSDNGMDAECIKNRSSNRWYEYDIPENIRKTNNYFSKNNIALKNPSIVGNINQKKVGLPAIGEATGRKRFKFEKQAERLKPLFSKKSDNCNLLNPFNTKSKSGNNVQMNKNPPFLSPVRKQQKPSDIMNYDENFRKLTQYCQIPNKEFNSSKVTHNRVDYYLPTMNQIQNRKYLSRDNSPNNFNTNKLYVPLPTSKTLFNQNTFESTKKKTFPIQQYIIDCNNNYIPSKLLTPKHSAGVISMPISTEIRKPTVRLNSDAYKNVSNIKPIYNYHYYSAGSNNYNYLPVQLFLRNNSPNDVYNKNYLHPNIMKLSNPFIPKPVTSKNYITSEGIYKTLKAIHPVSGNTNIFPTSGVHNAYSHMPKLYSYEYWPKSKSLTSSFAQRGYSYIPFKKLIRKRFENNLFSMDFQKNKISKTTPRTSKGSQNVAPFVTQTSYISKSMPQYTSPSWPLPLSKNNWNSITTPQSSSSPFNFAKLLPCKTTSLATKTKSSHNDLLSKISLCNFPQNINLDQNSITQNSVTFQSNAYPMLLPSTPCQSYLEAIPMVQSAKSLINRIPSMQPLLESSSVIQPHGSISNKTSALISGPNIALTNLKPNHAIQREISIPNINNFYNYGQKQPMTFYKKPKSFQCLSNTFPRHKKGSYSFEQSVNKKIALPKINFNSMDLTSKYFNNKMPLAANSYKPNSPLYTNIIQSKPETLIQKKIFSINNVALPCRYTQGVQPSVGNALDAKLGYYTNSKDGIILKPLINPLLPNNMIALNINTTPDRYKCYKSSMLYRNSFNSPLKCIAPHQNAEFYKSPFPRDEMSNLFKKLQKIASYQHVSKPEPLTSLTSGTSVTNNQLNSIPDTILPTGSPMKPYSVPCTTNSLLPSNLFLPHVQRVYSQNPSQTIFQPCVKTGAYILSAPTTSSKIKTPLTPLGQLNSQKTKFSKQPRGKIPYNYNSSVYLKSYPSNMAVTNAESGLLNNARKKILSHPAFYSNLNSQAPWSPSVLSTTTPITKSHLLLLRETTNFYKPKTKIPNIKSYKSSNNYEPQTITPANIKITPNLKRQSLTPLSSSSKTSNILPSMVSLYQNTHNFRFNTQNINKINPFLIQSTTPYNKAITYNLMVDTKPSHVQLFIDEYYNNNKNIKNSGNLYSRPKYVNDLFKNINHKVITKPSIVIAKYEPFIKDYFIIQTEDNNIVLKAWRSKLKIIKPRIVYDVHEVRSLNFMPMIKNAAYPPEKAVNIAISFVIKKYGHPIVINGVYSYSQPYAIINDFNVNNIKNNIVTLIWPTFCNCGCCKSGCQCLRIKNIM